MNKRNNLGMMSVILSIIILITPIAVSATPANELHSMASSEISLDTLNGTTTIDGKEIIVLDKTTAHTDEEISATPDSPGKVLLWVVGVYISGKLSGRIEEYGDRIVLTIYDNHYRNSLSTSLREYKELPRNIRSAVEKGVVNPQSNTVRFYDRNECVLAPGGIIWICKYSL